MQRYQNYGPTILRFGLGTVFLLHSLYLKVVVYTVSGTVGYFESIGLPGFSAYLVMAAEIAGGVALLAGVRVREAASVLAVVAAGATWVHLTAGWLFTNDGGGFEYPLFLTVACVVQTLLGPGALAFRGGRWSHMIVQP